MDVIGAGLWRDKVAGCTRQVAMTHGKRETRAQRGMAAWPDGYQARKMAKGPKTLGIGTAGSL